MHHTLRKACQGGLAFCLGFLTGCWLAGAAQAQQLLPSVVGNTLTIPINGSHRLQMTTKKPIKTVINQRDNVLRVSPIPDTSDAVMLIGLEYGVSKLTLTDKDGKVEEVEVMVQYDVEPLRKTIRRVCPKANVEPIASANNTIILSGYVAHAQDVDIVMRIAEGMVQGQQRIVNALTVGGVMQVQLDVVVAQVSRTQFRALAFNFLTQSQHSFLYSTVGNAVTTPATIGNGGVVGPGGSLFGAPGTPNGGPTNLFFGVLHDQSGFLAFLQALKTEDVSKLLAQPSVVTQSGTPARILSGGQQAIPVPAGLGAVGIQYQDFGTLLEFLPIVLGNGKIHLEVQPEVSGLDPAFGTSIQGTIVPGLTIQRVRSTVELEDGQTFVIGGLIQRTVTGHLEKVPILGDLPFLGAAFSSKSYKETETELVILVTPRLVEGSYCNQLPKLLPGQETRRPDNFELFLEQMLEAPAGPRDVFQNHRYVPAHINVSTMETYPCPEFRLSHCRGRGDAVTCGMPGSECGVQQYENMGTMPRSAFRMSQPSPVSPPAPGQQVQAGPSGRDGLPPQAPPVARLQGAPSVVAPVEGEVIQTLARNVGQQTNQKHETVMPERIEAETLPRLTHGAVPLQALEDPAKPQTLSRAAAPGQGLMRFEKLQKEYENQRPTHGTSIPDAVFRVPPVTSPLAPPAHHQAELVAEQVQNEITLTVPSAGTDIASSGAGQEGATFPTAEHGERRASAPR